MDFSKVRSNWWSGNCYHFEQLNAIISSTDVNAYAYILHDKCKKEDGSNELKKPHYHFLLQFTQTQRGSWFKAYNSDDMGIVFFEQCRAPLNAFNYLIHDTPTARKQNKHLYDPSERMSTIDSFETEEKIDENAELYDDLIDLLDGKITWHDLIKKKPKRLHMIANIKVGYDMLFFERHGRRYFEPNYPKPPPRDLRRLSPKEAEDLPW